MNDDREPWERWFTKGTGFGLLVGLLIGLLLGDIVVGLMIGVIMGSGIGVLSNPKTRRGGDPPDPHDREPPRSPSDEDGAMDRGVLWLLVGLLVAGLVVVATAPELFAADPAALGQLFAVVLAAAVPGVVIVAVVAIRRRGQTDDEEA